jgi:hypothetical protein
VGIRPKGRRDQARAYTVARGELVEAVAAVEIAVSGSEASAEALARVLGLGNEICAMLTKLIR